MINLGFDNYVPVCKIKAIIPYDTARIRKEVAKLKDMGETGTFVDASKHKAIKSVVIMDDGCYIVSIYTSTTLAKRIKEMGGAPNA